MGWVVMANPTKAKRLKIPNCFKNKVNLVWFRKELLFGVRSYWEEEENAESVTDNGKVEL